jgi:proline racemase
LSSPPTFGAGADARAAVVPTITGTAWITGFASYVLDPEDPFPAGYTLGDIW